MKILSIVLWVLLTMLTVYLVVKFLKLNNRLKTIKARGAVLSEEDIAFFNSQANLTMLVSAIFTVTTIINGIILAIGWFR